MRRIRRSRLTTTCRAVSGGRRIRMRRPSHGRTTLTYFDAGTPSFLLKGLRTTGPSGTLQDLTYDYDAAGNIRNITDALGTAGRHYEYDALARLTHADGMFGPGQSRAIEDYVYD